MSNIAEFDRECEADDLGQQVRQPFPRSKPNGSRRIAESGIIWGPLAEAGDYPTGKVWTCIGFVTAQEIRGRLLVKSLVSRE